MAAEGVAVQEGLVALEERRHQPVAGDHRAERGVPRGDALGAGDDVGLVAVALGAEPVAEPAEGADDLVADQQHVVLVADLADPLEVAGRGREAAAGVLHRLEEHRGDGVGALVLDRDRDLVGGPAAEGLEVSGGTGLEALGGAVEVGVGHPERRRDERLERRLHHRDAGDRQRALRRAVVGDRAADHLVLGGLAGELEVVLGELPRGLDGLAAAAGEEDAVEVAGRVARDPLGQLHGLRVGVGPQRHEGELGGLLGRRLGDVGAAVPELVDEQAGEPVEVALALGVVEVGTLAAHDHGHLALLVDRVAREVQPQVVATGLLQAGELVVGVGGGKVVRHGYRCPRALVVVLVGGERSPRASCRREGEPSKRISGVVAVSTRNP